MHHSLNSFIYVYNITASQISYRIEINIQDMLKNVHIKKIIWTFRLFSGFETNDFLIEMFYTIFWVHFSS